MFHFGTGRHTARLPGHAAPSAPILRRGPSPSCGNPFRSRQAPSLSFRPQGEIPFQALDKRFPCGRNDSPRYFLAGRRFVPSAEALRVAVAEENA